MMGTIILKIEKDVMPPEVKEGMEEVAVGEVTVTTTIAYIKMIHFLPTVGTSGESAFRTTWG